MNITGIGELLWDVYPEHRHPGGAVANCIHHVNALGQTGVLVSRVGDDPDGNALLQTLGRNGVDVSYVSRDPERATGWVAVTLDDRKQPVFRCNKDAPYDYLKWDSRWPELIERSDAVIFGTFAQRTALSAATTRRFLDECTASVRVFDLNIRAWNEHVRQVIRDSLPRTDLLKLNDAELKKLRELFPGLPESEEDALYVLIDMFGLKLACLTLGEEGCVVSDGDRLVRSPGLSVDVVDTTGAGDAFTAAMTVRYLAGDTLEETAASANRLAAFVCTREGAAPEYSAEEQEGIIRR